MEKALIIAGGTGGHIFPGLAIADALKAKGVHVDWLGAQVGMEKNLVGTQYPLHLLSISGIRGKGLVKKVLAPWRLMRSAFQASRLIKKINPDVVIGLGGYASGPGGIAAWLLRKPLIIHEQNAVPGLTNRVLSHVARGVFEAFPNTFSKKIKAIAVGNPVRLTLNQLPDSVARFANRKNQLRVLVLGGSQGAVAINQHVAGLLPMLAGQSTVQFWHQTGQRDLERIQALYKAHTNLCYRVEPFITDMAKAYAWADIVICRAGALTVSELSAVGLGSILVPFPFAVDDHQTANARHLSDQMAGILMPQESLSSQKLYDVLTELAKNPDKILSMAKQARSLNQADSAQKMIQYCEQLVSAGRS